MTANDMKPSIVTPRLLLRTMVQADMEQLLFMFKNDQIRQTYMIPDFPSEEAAMQLAQRFIALSAGEEKLVAGIAQGETLIGFINEVESGEDWIELGYALHPAYHGRGYMTEALSAMISDLFDRSTSCVLAGAFEENTASIRVMEKCGMTRIEKTESIDYRGKCHRCIYYAIKRSEGLT